MIIYIKVKDSCGTYKASTSARSERASCTAGAKQAATALARKIFGAKSSDIVVEKFKCKDSSVDISWFRAELATSKVAHQAVPRASKSFNELFDEVFHG
ncbi:MAG: hypothetical protein R3332_08455 [Pseudohongiellaceae bacterium]|nr:hypothetical protein [Pseudohongiellaceae bacterium]